MNKTVFENIIQNIDIQHIRIFLYEGFECTIHRNNSIVDCDTGEYIGNVDEWFPEIAIIKLNNKTLWEDMK